MNLVVIMAVAALILVGVAFAVANSDAGMPGAPRDLADTGLPADRPMTPDDVDSLRFSMAPRGYRMAEVDDAMARLRDELAGRDAEIDRLRNPTPEDELSESEQLGHILELPADAESEPRREEAGLTGVREGDQSAAEDIATSDTHG